MRKSKIPQQLEVSIEGHTGTVLRKDYERAKLNQMREFGYPTLTLKEVSEQVDAVLSKKKFGRGLTIIGKFMEDEISEKQK